MEKIQRTKFFVEKILSQIGIKINGQSVFDPQIQNEKTYQRIFNDGSLGLGEAFMDGWWDCEQLDEMMARVLRHRLDRNIHLTKMELFYLIINSLFNLQTMRRAFIVGKKHYDISNELYAAMLDKNMIYSCAYWKDADNLEQAQINKLDLICRKLYLKPGMSLLDIGCGWGGLAKFAAENYGVSVVGITISKEQYELAKERCKNLPVEIRWQDYRELNQSFDRIVSVGMFEHVGYKNYPSYMKVVQQCLKDDGLFLLHTIGKDYTTRVGDPWITKYIFPNSILPSLKQIAKASEKIFVMEDWHNFSADYDKTLMAWYSNFNNHWHELKNKFDDRFYRMWKYYLLSCAGAFRARSIQLWQIVFSKNGKFGGYLSIR